MHEIVSWTAALAIMTRSPDFFSNFKFTVQQEYAEILSLLRYFAAISKKYKTNKKSRISNMHKLHTSDNNA